jgi:hypothetical protein
MAYHPHSNGYHAVRGCRKNRKRVTGYARIPVINVNAGGPIETVSGLNLQQLGTGTLWIFLNIQRSSHGCHYLSRIRWNRNEAESYRQVKKQRRFNTFNALSALKTR